MMEITGNLMMIMDKLMSFHIIIPLFQLMTTPPPPLIDDSWLSDYERDWYCYKGPRQHNDHHSLSDSGYGRDYWGEYTSCYRSMLNRGYRSTAAWPHCSLQWHQLDSRKYNLLMNIRPLYLLMGAFFIKKTMLT